MKKNKKVIVLVSFIFSLNHLFCQSIISGQNDGFYITPQNDSFFVKSYVVQNKSKEDLWMWFDPQKGDNLSDNVKRYFYVQKGDYALLEILNDESVSNKKLNIIGQTFIKCIRSKSEFTIHILFDKWDNALDDAVKNRVVLIKSSDLRSGLQNSLVRNKEYCFSGDVIVFDSKHLKNLY